MAIREITGRKVFIVTASAFAIIIGVNLTLAYNAVATFPGVETKNSYAASQTFNDERAAQEALGWTVRAEEGPGVLTLSITDADGTPVEVERLEAVLGRATHVAEDRIPDFVYYNGAYVADEELEPGNWNLRMVAEAEDGTIFRQRVVIRAR